MLELMQLGPNRISFSDISCKKTIEANAASSEEHIFMVIKGGF